MTDTTQRGSSSRRDFLKAAAGGAAASVAGVGSAVAAPRSLTLLHESSFIRTYDAHVQQKLAPACEKLTGIKINYELASVGTLQTRVTWLGRARVPI